MEQPTLAFKASVLVGGNAFSSPPGSGVGADLKNPSGIAVDQRGHIYVADTENDCIRVLPPEGAVFTLDVGPGLNRPWGLVVDPVGTLWVKHGYQYSRWAKLMPDGGLETVLEGGHEDRPYLDASAIAFDAHGTLYFVDALQNRLLKRNDTGEVTPVAGSGQKGFADGPSATAKFNAPRGLVADAHGNFYVAEANHRIRKVTPEGQVSTFAGGNAGHRDGQGREAEFYRPDALFMSPNGTLYVSEAHGARIRMITPDAVVTTLVGTVESDKNHNQMPIPGEAVAWAPDGTLLVVSRAYHAVLRVTESVGGSRNSATPSPGRRWVSNPPMVVTVAGGMRVGNADGPPDRAEFNEPMGVAVVGNGTLLVADSLNHRIRTVEGDGTTRTWAGWTCGYADGVGPEASFQAPTGLTVTSSGAAYVADSGNNRIRVIRPSGEVVTLAGQDNWKEIVFHLDENTTGVIRPDGTEILQPLGNGLGWIDYADGAASEAKFNEPRGIALDRNGSLLVADSRNAVIRRVDAGGTVFTLKIRRPNEGLFERWGGSSPEPDRLSRPTGLAVGPDGSLYVSEAGLSRVSRIAAEGEVHLVAGGKAGCADGSGSEAQFDEPAGLAMGPDGNLYVADSKNHRICRITPTGDVATVAGGACGYRDGLGAQARFNEPWGLAFDDEGNLLVSDRKNHSIRKLLLRAESPDSGLSGPEVPNTAAIIYAHAPDQVVHRRLAPFGSRLDRWDQLPGRRIRAITENIPFNAILIHFDDAWVEIEGIGHDPFPYFKDELWGQGIHFHPSHLHGLVITSVVATFDRPGGNAAHAQFKFDNGTEQWLEPFYGDGLRIS